MHTRVFQGAIKEFFHGLYEVTNPDEAEIRYILCHINQFDPNILRKDIPIRALEDIPESKVPLLCSLPIVIATDTSRLHWSYAIVQELGRRFWEELLINVELLRSGGATACFDDILPESKRSFALAAERFAKAMMKLPYVLNNSVDSFKDVLPFNIILLEIKFLLSNDPHKRSIMWKNLSYLKSSYFVFFNRVCDDAEMVYILRSLRPTRI